MEACVVLSFFNAMLCHLLFRAGVVLDGIVPNGLGVGTTRILGVGTVDGQQGFADAHGSGHQSVALALQTWLDSDRSREGGTDVADLVGSIVRGGNASGHEDGSKRKFLVQANSSAEEGMLRVCVWVVECARSVLGPFMAPEVCV